MKIIQIEVSGYIPTLLPELVAPLGRWRTTVLLPLLIDMLYTC